MFRLVLVACAVLFLAACSSGGDGGSGPAVPVVDPVSTRSLTGLTPPTFSDASILPTTTGIVQRSDSMTISDFVVKTSDGDYLAPTSCSRTSCFADFGDGFTFSASLRELQQAALDPSGVRYSGVGEKSGVRLAQGQGRIPFSTSSADYTGYEGWLDYSTFGVALLSVQSDNNLAGGQIAYGGSFGNDTGTRPTGSATWSGIMVGGTDINGPPQSIQGDASLSYDWRFNYLDVAFTNVWNLDTRGRFSDMRWYDLPVGSDGSFKRETNSTDIEGRFYGPGHAEVGGIFAHPAAIGAFGAKRQ